MKSNDPSATKKFEDIKQKHELSSSHTIATSKAPMNQLPTPKSFDSPSPKDCKEQDEPHPQQEQPQPQHIYIQETPQERLYRISKLLESMSIADVDAVNSRDWSPSSALFQNKSTYWEASTTATLSSKKLTVQGFVDSIRKKVEMSPNFKLRIIDFTTTVDEGKGRAEIFANMEVTGDWSGVAQRNVTHLEYHLIDGEWKHVSHRTMPGMDPMSLSFG